MVDVRRSEGLEEVDTETLEGKLAMVEYIKRFLQLLGDNDSVSAEISRARKEDELEHWMIRLHNEHPDWIKR